MVANLTKSRMPPKTRLDKEDKSGSGDDKCGHCLKAISDQDCGIICDICNSWFHSRCQGVTEAMYKALNQHSKELFWFCKDCRQGAEKLFPSISKIQTKVNTLEDEAARVSIDLKTELTRTISAIVDLKQEIAKIGGRIEQCERKVDENKQGLDSSIGSKLVEMENNILKNEGPKWSGIVSREVESKMAQATTDIVSAQKSLQQQTKAIFEDQQEKEEINKRRFSIIIHGLVESSDENAETRTREDEDKITNLLHEISCDEVSVSDMVRLGKRPDENTTKPRPIKLTLASEGQKEKILRRSKNLKRNSNGLEKVFIHTDLTPKQRERRHQLVQEMKLRQTKGETDLIIVNGKIVKKWRPMEKEVTSAVSSAGIPTQTV